MMMMDNITHITTPPVGENKNNNKRLPKKIATQHNRNQPRKQNPNLDINQSLSSRYRQKGFGRMRAFQKLVAIIPLVGSSMGFTTRSQPNRRRTTLATVSMAGVSTTGNLHGHNSCFLPLKQMDQDYFAPRIVQIAGAYPGLTREEFFAVQSEPAAIEGQWTYDFSDPDGPQLGTVAIDGSDIVSGCEDPVVVIAEHTSLAVPLPDSIKEPVDLVVLVDRAMNRFGERRFLVVDVPGSGLIIAAYTSKEELPPNGEILGQVVLTQIPWLPSMKATKSGFLEADEYF